MLIQCQNEAEWVRTIETELQEFGGTAATVFLPAGETPKPLYRKWRSDFPAAFHKYKFLQVDEIMDGQKRFEAFFTEELPHLPVQPPRDFNVRPDVAVLGLGLNGHVGFHEPHVEPDFYSGCVKLSATSCERLGIKTGTWGLTFGLGCFMRARKILLLVRGHSKQDVLKAVLHGDPSLPATVLTRHPQFKVLNCV
jgi:6-phosphogluconolactonase/glucosamine-6-phosphate isomerase/deaminase